MVKKVIFICNFILILALVSLTIFTLPVFAGTGTGGKTGGGADEPLTITSSDPKDGQKDVPVDVSIKLVFSKNVTNMSVKDNNLKCFTLTTGDEVIPVKVVIADDQVEPEKKNNIEVTPEKQLKPGTLYKLKISGNLQSKSGGTLEKDNTVSFTTVGASTGKNDISTVKKYGYLILVAILAVAISFTIFIIYVFRKKSK